MVEVVKGKDCWLVPVLQLVLSLLRDKRVHGGILQEGRFHLYNNLVHHLWELRIHHQEGEGWDWEWEQELLHLL